MGLVHCNAWAARCLADGGEQAIALVPKLAAARTRTLHPRIQRGAALGLLHRWWGLLGVAVQRAAAGGVLNSSGDLPRAPLEAVPWLGELEVV